MFIGLQADSLYTFYVKAICGEEESSITNAIEVRTNSVPSDNPTIAEGTATSSYIPVYGLYCDHTQMSQSIYPASMLTSLSGNTITGLHYYVGSGANTNWATAVFNVRMGITTQDNLATGFATDALTDVYEGTLEVSLEEGMTITFSQPFTYMGGNLLIEFQLPIASGWTSCSFYGMTQESASRYEYDGLYSQTGASVNFLPQVDFICVPQSGCRKVTNLSVNDLTTESATFSWFPGGDETSWMVINSDTILTAAQLRALEADTIDALSITLNNLEPLTDYYFYIAGLCSDSIDSWQEYAYTTLATCLEPTALDSVVVEEDRAELFWTNNQPNFEGTFVVAYGLAETFNLANPATYTPISAQGFSKQISGLSSSTMYSFAVKAICTEEDNSVWSNVVTFMSGCMNYNLPYMIGFEEESDNDLYCWTSYQSQAGSGSGTDYGAGCWTINRSSTGTSVHSGLSSAQLLDSKAGTHTILASPRFNVPEDGMVRVSFWMYRSTSSSTNMQDEGVKLWISSTTSTEDGKALMHVTRSGVIPADSLKVAPVRTSGWYQYYADVNPTENFYILFEGISEYGFSSYIDDIRISRIATADTIYEETCSGEAYEGHGFSIATTDMVVGENIYTRLLEAVTDLQADTLYTLVLNVGQSKVTYLTDTVCAFAEYNRYGFNISSVRPNRTEPYERHEETALGCDSLISLTLFVPQYEFAHTVAICEGEEYVLGDTVLTTGGVYTRTLYGVQYGCDSIVTLTLNVLPTHVTLDERICEGESYMFDGVARTTTGTYTATFINSLGCDSIVTLNLTVDAKTSSERTGDFCSGSVYMDTDFYGLNKGGIYTDTLINAAGCDSIITLTLIEHKADTVNIEVTIQEGDVYVFGNQTYDKAGQYEATFINQYGCDSVVFLDLKVSTDLIEVLNDAQIKGAEKFIYEGLLYIRVNDALYDARGKKVMIRKEED